MSLSMFLPASCRSFRKLLPFRLIRRIAEMVGSACNTVFMARDLRNGGRYVGTLTLVMFRVPTGVRAWIEDVIVDENQRGTGIGEMLNREALRIAERKG